MQIAPFKSKPQSSASSEGKAAQRPCLTSLKISASHPSIASSGLSPSRVEGFRPTHFSVWGFSSEAFDVLVVLIFIFLRLFPSEHGSAYGCIYGRGPVETLVRNGHHYGSRPYSFLKCLGRKLPHAVARWRTFAFQLV